MPGFSEHRTSPVHPPRFPDAPASVVTGITEAFQIEAELVIREGDGAVAEDSVNY